MILEKRGEELRDAVGHVAHDLLLRHGCLNGVERLLRATERASKFRSRLRGTPTHLPVSSRDYGVEQSVQLGTGGELSTRL
jgi:hypothetical protein